MIILIALHIFVSSNLQFTVWPEVFSFPYMIDNGFLIYKDFHHVYQPLLTYILLGTYKLFSFKLVVLKVFTYVLIGLTDLMIYLNIKKITKDNILSLFILSLYILLQPIFDGNMLWYDIAVTLPVLVSIYFINSNLFLSGLFVAIAFLVKQQAVLLCFPIFIYLIYKKENLKNILKFIYGCITPIAILTILLFKLNIFRDYLFWTFEFPLFYLPNIEGYTISPNKKELVILLLMGLTIISGFVLNLKKISSMFYILISVLFFMTLSAFPRFSLFHLQPALAVYVLIIGYLFNLKNKYFLLFILPTFILWKNVLISAKYEDRFYSQEEIKFSSEIENRVGDSKVYFLGPSSIEYVLSNTVPPKPWIENYVWHFEILGMQQKVIDGWKKDSPQYIYWSKPKSGNWYDLDTYQPKEIVKYIRENYRKTDEKNNIEIWKLQ